MKRRDKGLYNSCSMYSFPLFPFKVPLIPVCRQAGKYIRYGKEKLAVLYEKFYGQKISAWQIQKTIGRW